METLDSIKDANLLEYSERFSIQAKELLLKILKVDLDDEEQVEAVSMFVDSLESAFVMKIAGLQKEAASTLNDLRKDVKREEASNETV